MKARHLFLLAILFFVSGNALAQVTFELWGMTTGGGGPGSAGTIFKTTAGVAGLKLQRSFIEAWYPGNNGRQVCPNGYSPDGGLVQASNGKLYGTTTIGGVHGGGVLFEYNIANGVYTVRVDFSLESGSYPDHGGLILAPNGKLYGLNHNGGANDKGTLFEFDPDGSYTKKLDFDGSNGAHPDGGLILASNGKFYGMTEGGGSLDKGILFEYDLDANILTKKLEFDGIIKGENPFGDLVEASNGKLYGTTYSGGVNNLGVLFEFDPSNGNYSKQVDFDGVQKGSHPIGSLTEAYNHKLYGLTVLGGTGTWSEGVLFEFDPASSTYSKKLDFEYQKSGCNPFSGMTLAPNGKLYGMTHRGGVGYAGVIFEFDPTTNALTKSDFTQAGQVGLPLWSKLLVINSVTVTTGIENIPIITSLYPNPADQQIEIVFSEAGDKKLEIMGVDGRVLQTTSATGDKTTLQVADYSSGIYIVKVSTASKNEYLRFVKR